jgi:hypothetical protein
MQDLNVWAKYLNNELVFIKHVSLKFHTLNLSGCQNIVEYPRQLFIKKRRKKYTSSLKEINLIPKSIETIKLKAPVALTDNGFRSFNPRDMKLYPRLYKR